MHPIDESGDHGLNSVDDSFPVFALCGILISEEIYQQQCRRDFDLIKTKYWGTKNVIFHSRDIRKCQKEFQILLDLDVKRRFYEDLNNAISGLDFTIISAVIDKRKYIEKYGRLADDPYEIALSYIIERTVFCLDGIKQGEKVLSIFAEKRGIKEDNNLSTHFQKIRSYGTYYVDGQRLRNYQMKFGFKAKKENVNGLQLSDLVAYPLATYVISPARANPAFDLIEGKIYCNGARKYGLKIFP